MQVQLSEAQWKGIMVGHQAALLRLLEWRMVVEPEEVELVVTRWLNHHSLSTLLARVVQAMDKVGDPTGPPTRRVHTVVHACPVRGAWLSHSQLHIGTVALEA